MKYIKDNIYKILGISFVIIILISSFFWGETNHSNKKVDHKSTNTLSKVLVPDEKNDISPDCKTLSSAETEKVELETASDGNIIDSSGDNEKSSDSMHEGASDADNISMDNTLQENNTGSTISTSTKPEQKNNAFIHKQNIDIEIYENNNQTDKSEQQTEETSKSPIKSDIKDINEDKKVDDNKLTCTMSIRCDTILNNIAYFDDNKKNIIPNDGSIFYKTDVVFYEEESVFNVLVREMKKNKIHLEFVNTPSYGSAYIEGIANIYEYDCGELSGWMYKVNGQFPNYGSSKYKVSDGDIIEWVYTCDLGKDVGGSGSARNGK